MINKENAEMLRTEYLTRKPRKTIRNVCSARKNWNGCDYADVYSGMGCDCWKQDGKHNCIRCREEARQ